MDTKTALLVLENSPLFSVLGEDMRVMIGHHATLQAVAKHQPLYRNGQSTQKCYFLLRGLVKITTHAERKDIIKYVVREGMLFGESFLTGEMERRDNAYAMDDQVQFLEIDAWSIVEAMRVNFGFAQSLLQHVGERLRHAEIQLERVVLKDSRSRILEFLHQIGTEQGKKVGYETLVRHDMTHQDIADLTGTSRQMVTAVLNQLKRTNLLYFNRKKILFRDLGALPMTA
jgi:CRP-like cAMP-binding protein